MSALWSLTELIEATGGCLLDPQAVRATANGVTIDSRNVQASDLFIALVGERFDGHDFVVDAHRDGAALALVSRPVLESGPAILVEDTQAALVGLARAARARSAARIAAVTGSVGKTSTKDMLALALGVQGVTHASQGNLNNHIGVPLSLARMPADCTYGVFELGMSHPGEILPLAQQVRPHAAIVTAVAPAHLEFFDSIEAIADEKISIIAGLEPGGTILLPTDSEHYAYLRQKAEARGDVRIVSYGSHATADIGLAAVSSDEAGSAVTALIHGEKIRYRLPVPGRHWVLNSLGVLGLVVALGADPLRCAAAWRALSPAKGRGSRQIVSLPAGGEVLLVDDSYNASPAAMRAAFEVLRTIPAQRRLAFLGDMLELGPTAPRLHSELAAAATTAGIDLVYTCGPLAANLHDRLPLQLRGGHAPTAADLAPLAANAIRAGDAILVKGSLGSRMGLVVQAIAGLNTEPAAPAEKAN